MSHATPPPLKRQVARVRRRLFLGTLLQALAWAWAASLLVAAGWFLAQPFVLRDPPGWLRWAVPAALAVVATVAALVLAALRTPSPVGAALALDERFHLKERVTTGLTLRPDESASPAGQALLADVDARLAGLRVGERFPVRVPWTQAALVPAGALALLLVLFFWHPRAGAGKPGSPEDEPASPVAKAKVDKEVKQLLAGKKKKPDEPKSEELERIQAEIEDFARKPRGTRDEIRDRIKDATDLEEQIQKQRKEQAARVDAFKEQMKQLERVTKKNEDEKKAAEGPARGLDKAVKDGDFKKAQQEAERLRKRLEAKEEAEHLRKRLEEEKLTRDERKEIEERLRKREKDRLSKEEREKLQKQLKDLQDQVERLTRNKDLEDELRRLAKEGKIDPEQLERELEQLKKNADKLDKELADLKELAAELGECEKCLKEGKDGQAGKKLEGAAGKLGKLGKDGEGQEMAAKLAQVRAVRRALAGALGGPGGPASGQRPEGAGGKTGSEEKRVRGPMEKGKVEVVGTAPGEGFKGPRKPSEMREEIRQAAQEAPAAIDRQRLPASAKKMARGYFEKVRGPEKDKKPDKP
jgi:hypothetical protein